jgi:hypothetical protein
MRDEITARNTSPDSCPVAGMGVCNVQLAFRFNSFYISGAQRFPKGNTLICEGVGGRVFEVAMKVEMG